MFAITAPKAFKIGDTITCRVNRAPQRVTWRDADTLVIEPDDPRAILAWQVWDDCMRFACADRGAGVDDYKVEVVPGDGIYVYTKPRA